MIILAYSFAESIESVGILKYVLWDGVVGTARNHV